MFKLIPVLFLLALNLNADKADEARSAASSARISAIGSQGAVQVTQVHTEAQTRILVNLVEQNDQIIAALKDIAAAKGNPTQVEQNDQIIAALKDIAAVNKQKSEVLPKFDKMQAILVGLQCVSTMGILVIAMRRKLASQ